MSWVLLPSQRLAVRSFSRFPYRHARSFSSESQESRRSLVDKTKSTPLFRAANPELFLERAEDGTLIMTGWRKAMAAAGAAVFLSVVGLVMYEHLGSSSIQQEARAQEALKKPVKTRMVKVSPPPSTPASE